MSYKSNYFVKKSIEEVRNYWNNRPCNIRHSTKKIGTLDYFNDVENRKYFVEPHIPYFANFKKWRGKKVLEIGCGIGTDTINFSRAGAKVTSVDLSEESLRIAKKRAEIFGCDVTFYMANAEELSKTVPIEKYDLIYSFGVIHHTPNPENVLSEIQKYMDSESTLKMMVYNRASWKALWILMTEGRFQFWKLDYWVAKYSEAQSGCPVTYTYTRKTVQDLLKSFQITEFAVDHIFSYSIKHYKNHIYKKVWYFRWLPHPIFRYLEKRYGWHLCVTAKLRNLK